MQQWASTISCIINYVCTHCVRTLVIRTHLVRTATEITNMVPSNNKSPGGSKTTHVWLSKAVNLPNHIRIRVSGNIFVVDPSIATGVNIIPVGGYNCRPIYAWYVGGIQGKVAWGIGCTQWQGTSTGVDIKEWDIATIINLDRQKVHKTVMISCSQVDPQTMQYHSNANAALYVYVHGTGLFTYNYIYV